MTSNAIAVPTYSAAQRREASEWFIVIRDEKDPAAQTLQAWLRWMEADEGNRLAFEAVSAAWHQTSPSLMVAMPTATELAEDTYDGTVPVAQWRPASARAVVVEARTRKMPGRTRAAQIAFGMAAVFVWVVASWFIVRESLRPAAPSWGTFETGIGEHRQLELADGSQVSLGAKSRLVVNFTGERREMRLETGEAFFEVEKDAKRPFVVRALGGAIVALGTSFDVHTVRDRVTVMVAEGAVSVRDTPLPARGPALSASGEQVKVSSGQQVTLTSSGRGPLIVRAATDLAERMRWREGWLIYRNAPLGDVIADVSRYTDRRIEVSDRKAAELRFSGAVFRGAVEEWLTALPEAFPVTVETVEQAKARRQ